MDGAQDQESKRRLSGVSGCCLELKLSQLGLPPKDSGSWLTFMPLVIDNGTFMVKAGFAVEETPQTVFLSVVGRSRVHNPLPGLSIKEYRRVYQINAVYVLLFFQTVQTLTYFSFHITSARRLSRKEVTFWRVQTSNRNSV